MNDRMNGRRAQGWNRAGGGTAGGRDISAWALGLLCGFGEAAAHEALQLPLGLALALASGLPLLGLALRQVLRPRRRAVVWEEVSWHAR